MRTDIIIPLVVYLACVFLLSLYTYLKRKTVNQFADYFIGNRTMGGGLLAMTLVATYISASSFISGPGAAYKFGLGWVLLAMIQVPTILLTLGVLGKKIAILARQYQAITLSDILYAHYKSRAIVWFANLSLIVAFIGAMTVKFVGGAYLLETAAGIPYKIGLLIFGLCTVIYTAFGGFRASVLNDAFQGLVMLIGAILLLTAIIFSGGGLSHIIATLKTIDPTLLTPTGPNDTLNFSFMASFWVLVCFGTIGLPHTAIRCMAYKDSDALHRGIIIGTIVITMIMFTMHLAGALGRSILPNLTSPDHVIPQLIIYIMHPFAAGIFLAAPLSAIMSTINAQLLQVSSIMVNDLLLRSIPKNTFSDKMLMRVSVLITLLLGLLLLFTAWHPPDMLIWLNLLAFGGLEAVFLWPLILGLYWKKANAIGALTSMVTGAIVYIGFTQFSITIFNFHAIIPTLVIGLIAFWLGNQFHKSEE